MAGSWSYVSSCTVGKSEFFVYDDIFFGTDDIRAIEHRDNTPGIGNASHSDYDLTGRRVTSPRRGIYIVNGRKVVVSCGAIRLKVAE